MAIRYYRKLFPGTAVVIGMTYLKFSTKDNVVGFFATDDIGVQNEFEKFAKEQRYGIFEITEEEFNRDYREKKTMNPSASGKLWREDLSRSESRQGVDPSVPLGSGSVQAALRVNGSLDVRNNNRTGVESLESPSAVQGGATLSEPVQDKNQTPAKYVPNVGRRKPAPQKKTP